LAAKKILAKLRAQFDYVVVDSSPLLAVTDASILAADADGALIVARYGQITRERLAQAVRSLGDVGAPLLGAIFTLTPARGNASYSYNYSYYGDRKKQSGSHAAANSADRAEF
jgi:receptor protein-tyrosine kinase